MNLPASAELAIADIASVFHWSLESLMALPLEELCMWHGMAVERAFIAGV